MKSPENFIIIKQTFFCSIFLSFILLLAVLDKVNSVLHLPLSSPSSLALHVLSNYI